MSEFEGSEEFVQFAQITITFPISWEKKFNDCTEGGFEINLSVKQVQLIFGDTMWYIDKTEDLTIGQVFDQIYHSSFLSGKEYRLELDKWCAMDTDVFFALPLNKAFLCQGRLFLN